MKTKLDNSGPFGGLEIYKKRRDQFLEKIQGGVAIFFAQPEQIRNDDVPHPYRQDSSFFYLTGFPESDSVAVFDPASDYPYTLFVKPKDPHKELWTGFLYGLDAAKKYFGPDRVRSIEDLKTLLPDLLRNTSTVYYRSNEFSEHDVIVSEAVKKATQSRGRTGLGQPAMMDGKTILGEMRLKKSSEEIESLQKACDISAEAHILAMKACRPGMYEYELEAELLYAFKKQGSERMGYNPIVATGPNATVLHYTSNSCRCDDGELVLIDAGTEFGHLTADITRTFPVNGKFSKGQRALYQAVLDAQKELVAMVKPGIRFHDVHDRCVDLLTEAMIELGLLKGSKRDLIETNEFKRYFPHGTGHWLGMDVHDCGIYRIDGLSRVLEPGMCFTIEPGLYVPADDKTAPRELVGIGVRIEDDILVTASGHENLTSKVPKEINDIEALMKN